MKMIRFSLAKAPSILIDHQFPTNFGVKFLLLIGELMINEEKLATFMIGEMPHDFAGQVDVYLPMSY